MASAWGAFTKHKEELTSRRFRLRDRLRLFDAVVSSTVLYGCEVWTLRVDQQRRLRTVQRKMLRMVLNAKRWKLEATSSQESEGAELDEADDTDALEPWSDFLKRTARWTEEQLSKAGQKEWLAVWRERQWKWAGKLMTKDTHKWSSVATLWQPLIHSGGPRGRAQARPKKRWNQDFVDFMEREFPDRRGEWHAMARNDEEWASLGEQFAQRMCDAIR